MAAMLAAVDDGVGDICAELERLGVAEDTLIVFTSDNGPSRESRNWLDGTLDPYYGGTTGGLKGHKFSLFEGGIRVPGIVRWPRALPAGRVCADAVGSFDALPTALRAAGLALDGIELDGCDIREVLAGTAPPPARDLFWELGGQTAIRRGPLKLVLDGRLNEGDGRVDPEFLADLAADPSERVNHAASRPDTARELRDRARSWRAALEERWRSEFASGAAHGVTAKA
jgi:arylsulfatase A-like enzyme